MEVHASEGVYAVSFQGPAGPRMSAFADAVIGTLDAVPAGRGNGSGDAMRWWVYFCSAAGAAAGVMAVAMIRRGRRKGRAIDAQELWPR